MTIVREAMLSDPPTLEVGDTAQDAGQALARPEVRAVFVCDGERFVGVVTRKTLVREVVATGRDPGEPRSGRSPRSRTGPWTPRRRSRRPSGSWRRRTPSVFRSCEGERLVGVLSRSGLQRRLAEDDPPQAEPELV